MKGWDFDGVVSCGAKPDPGDVIITGRSIEEARVTLELMSTLGVNCPVFFNPHTTAEKTARNAAEHKARIIQLLGIRLFMEDSHFQADIITELARGVEVQMVYDGKIVSREVYVK